MNWHQEKRWMRERLKKLNKSEPNMPRWAVGERLGLSPEEISRISFELGLRWGSPDDWLFAPDGFSIGVL